MYKLVNQQIFNQKLGSFITIENPSKNKLKLTITNSIPDAILLYKIDLDLTSLIFENTLSRDHGAVDSGNQQVVLIDFKTSFDINLIKHKHTMNITIVKADHSNLYQMSSINVDTNYLLQKFDGYKYQFTFLPRIMPTINEIQLADFELSKEYNDLGIHVDGFQLLQETYFCFQTRYKYLQQQKLNDDLLEQYVQKTIYTKVGINYWSYMAIEDRISLINTTREQIKQSDYCYICFNQSTKQKVTCSICGAYLGCSERCALQMTTLHHAECEIFENYKLFDHKSGVSVEQYLNGQIQTQEQVQSEQTIKLVNNQDQKDQWILETQALMQQTNLFLQDIEDKTKEQKIVTVNTEISKEVYEEAQKIIALFNQTKEMKSTQISELLESDVQDLIQNLSKKSTKQSLEITIQRIHAIYKGYYDQMQAEAAQYKLSKEQYFRELNMTQQRLQEECALVVDQLTDQCNFNANQVTQFIADSKPSQLIQNQMQELHLTNLNQIDPSQMHQLLHTLEDSENQLQKLADEQFKKETVIKELKLNLTLKIQDFKMTQQCLQLSLDQNKKLQKVVDQIEKCFLGAQNSKSENISLKPETFQQKVEKMDDIQKIDIQQMEQSDTSVFNDYESVKMDENYSVKSPNQEKSLVDRSLAESTMLNQKSNNYQQAQRTASGKGIKSLETNFESMNEHYEPDSHYLDSTVASENHQFQNTMVSSSFKGSPYKNDNSQLKSSVVRYNRAPKQSLDEDDTSQQVTIDANGEVPAQVRQYKSLQTMYTKMKRFNKIFNSIGQNYQEKTYYLLMDLSAQMYSQLYVQMIQILQVQLIQFGVEAELDYTSLQAMETKLHPQTNLSLPIDFRIYLISWFQLAEEYSNLQQAVERMVYYCMARNPNVLDKEPTWDGPIPQIAPSATSEEVYFMLKGIK
ncbi:Conserved_hypothetical protein [Hexamita inflata]|uniref:Uncharacterized protein n=1 Tax=Hexamita inflata TaxID=28002 RepID=A0AA86NPY9_9EUKA|nr:Conserved hypothetical protein [Hexamita inflata]